jgi:hypothetical protein
MLQVGGRRQTQKKQNRDNQRQSAVQQVPHNSADSADKSRLTKPVFNQ